MYRRMVNNNTKERIAMNTQTMILLSQKLVMLSIANDDGERRKLTAEIASLGNALNEHTVSRTEQNVSSVPTSFKEFGLFWFENFHKRKVAEKTYKTDLSLFKRHIYNRFGDTPIKDINAKQLQEFVDEFVAQGKRRTAEDIHYKLSQIFKAAVKFDLITRNPVELIIRENYERKHGAALTPDEERLLLAASAGTHYQLFFAIALYTGLRPNEYKTVQIRGNMIVARNSKRKHGIIAYKRIPVVKMLKPYLNGVKEIPWVATSRIRAKFKTILPNHVLKDLRKTFYSHCITCKVDENARDEMVGHERGVLKTTYTDLPDEFLLKEAAKLVW